MIPHRRRKLSHQIDNVLFACRRILGVKLFLQNRQFLYGRVSRIVHLVIRDISNSICYAARRFGLIRLIWISIYRITYQVIRTAVFHIVPPSQKCSIIPRVPRISSTEQIVKCFGRTDTLISRTRRCIVGSKNPVQSIPRIIRRSGKIQLEDRFRRILHMVYKKIGITALQ